MTSSKSEPILNPDAVAVIVVNWNGWPMALQCVAALRSTVGAQWRLFLVDNASTDGSSEKLASLGADVALVQSPINGGWTGGNNLGIECAIAQGYRRILLLNPDAMVEPNTLANLIQASTALGGGIFGPVHLTGDGAGYDFVGTDEDPATRMPVWKGVSEEEVAQLPPLIETASIKGAGIFIDAEIFERLGLFDDKFYLNFDETDWCYRAREAGYVLRMVKAARIRHIGSASIGGMQSPLQTYFLTRNALLFAQKHFTLRQRWRALRRLYWEVRSLPRKNKAHLWIWHMLWDRDGPDAAFKLGVCDYLLGRFGDCPQIVRKWQAAGKRVVSSI